MKKYLKIKNTKHSNKNISYCDTEKINKYYKKNE